MTRVRNVVNFLTYLIAVIGVFPLLNDVGTGYAVVFFCSMIYGVWAETKNFKSVSRHWLNILSVFVIFYTISRMTMDNMVVPALEALIAIQAIKFLEPYKKFRDYMQIYMIATFMMAGSALISLSILFLFLTFIIFMLISVSMVLLTYMTEDDRGLMSVRNIYKIIFKTMAIPLLAIPVAVLLFAVLPRTNFPMFQFLNRADGLMTGFSDSVALGNISSIQEDTRLIFRAEMPEIFGESPYWRGVVMDTFDGKAWSETKQKSKRLRIPYPAEQVKQTIYLEPYGDKYLFGLNIPFRVDMQGSDREDGFVYVLRRPVQKRIQYDVFSGYEKYLGEFYDNYTNFLELPKLSPELDSFAESFESFDDKEELVNFLPIYFIRNGFKYSINRLPVSETPLEDFLFKAKMGNCEYYASAAAVILRKNGIPTRLVGGYIGGYYNTTGKYYAVPQKNAHVWVEAFIENKGWISIDPTPALPSSISGEHSWDFRMRMMADTVNFYWNAFVINYDFSKQVKAVKGIKKAAVNLKTDYKEMGKFFIDIIPFIVAIVIVLAFLKLRTSSFRFAGDERFAKKFRNILIKKGVSITQSQGLTEIYFEHPELRGISEEFIDVFQSSFYKGQKLSKQQKKRLCQILRRLKSFKIS